MHTGTQYVEVYLLMNFASSYAIAWIFKISHSAIASSTTSCNTRFINNQQLQYLNYQFTMWLVKHNVIAWQTGFLVGWTTLL